MSDKFEVTCEKCGKKFEANNKSANCCRDCFVKTLKGWGKESKEFAFWGNKLEKDWDGTVERVRLSLMKNRN